MLNDYETQWAAYQRLVDLRRDPIKATAEFLRENGWIVERPETLSLPVAVARSGSFTSEDGYKVTLHVRVTIGDRKYQVDYAIDARHPNMDVKAFSRPICGKFERAIMAELVPQIESGCERELANSKAEGDSPYV